VVLNSTGNDKAFLRSNVVHNEFLEDSSVDVADIAFQSVTGHAEGVVSVSCAEEVLHLVSRGIVVAEMFVEIVSLLVLGLGNVSGKDRAGLKSNIDHHLEHINSIVLDAVTAEVGAFLIVIHFHCATGHLDHAVVDGLVSVLESFQVSILQSEKGARCFRSLITSADID